MISSIVGLLVRSLGIRSCPDFHAEVAAQVSSDSKCKPDEECTEHTVQAEVGFEGRYEEQCNAQVDRINVRSDDGDEYELLHDCLRLTREGPGSEKKVREQFYVMLRTW